MRVTVGQRVNIPMARGGIFWPSLFILNLALGKVVQDSLLVSGTEHRTLYTGQSPAGPVSVPCTSDGRP